MPCQPSVPGMSARRQLSRPATRARSASAREIRVWCEGSTLSSGVPLSVTWGGSGIVQRRLRRRGIISLARSAGSRVLASGSVVTSGPPVSRTIDSMSAGQVSVRSGSRRCHWPSGRCTAMARAPSYSYVPCVMAVVLRCSNDITAVKPRQRDSTHALELGSADLHDRTIASHRTYGNSPGLPVDISF